MATSQLRYEFVLHLRLGLSASEVFRPEPPKSEIRFYPKAGVAPNSEPLLSIRSNF